MASSSRRRYTADQARQLILEGIFSEEETDEDSDQSDDSSSDSEDSINCDIIGASGDGGVRRGRDNRGLSRESNGRKWNDVSGVDPGPQLLEFASPEGPEPGPKQIHNLESASDFFKLFFTDSVVQDISEEINRYARDKISSQDLKECSRLKKWTSTDPSEVYRFFGVLLNMGIVKLPTIQSYWSTKWTSNVPFSVMQ